MSSLLDASSYLDTFRLSAYTEPVMNNEKAPMTVGQLRTWLATTGPDDMPVTVLTGDGLELCFVDVSPVSYEGGGAAPAFVALNVMVP